MNKKFITLLALPLVIGALAGCGGKKSYACDKLDFDDSLVVENPMTGEERTAFVEDVINNTLELLSGFSAESLMVNHDDEVWIEGHLIMNGKLFNNDAYTVTQKTNDMKTRLGKKIALVMAQTAFNEDEKFYESYSYSGSWHGEKFEIKEAYYDSSTTDVSRRLLNSTESLYRFSDYAQIEKNGEDYLAVYNREDTWTNTHDGQEYPCTERRQMVFEIAQIDGKNVLSGSTFIEEEWAGRDPITGEIFDEPTFLERSEKNIVAVEFGKDHGNLSDKEKQEVFDAIENGSDFESGFRFRHYYANNDGTISSDYSHSSYINMFRQVSPTKYRVFGSIDLNEQTGKDQYIAFMPRYYDSESSHEAICTNKLSDVYKKLPEGLEFVTVDDVEYLHIIDAEFEYGKQIFVTMNVEKVGDEFEVTFDKAVFEDFDPFSLGS